MSFDEWKERQESLGNEVDSWSSWAFQQTKIDELQKRIDGALTQVSNHYHSCVARKNLKRMSASVSEITEIESHESNMIVLENILRGEK